jgi:glucose/arabinose dehydrogenase
MISAPRRGTAVRLLLPLAAVALAAACGGTTPSSQAGAPAGTRSPAPAVSGAATAPPTARTTVNLTVPADEALSTPHTLIMPPGWTAQVWAQVPGARMEAWTPQGDLLVSQPGAGSIVELTPQAGGTPTSRKLLSGLTWPQGMAFARLDGRWVLYVAESDQIDRYPWGASGISGARTVIAAHLPDLDPSGDDVHRAKDVAVAPDGTVYFNVGSASNANPADLTSSPERALIMAVNPNGGDPRVVETGVRNGEGLAVAPDGTVWTAVNERDNIPYPSHSAYAGDSDAFGKVIQSFVDNHPPDEVVPVTAGRNLGWPYCNPDQDINHPAGSLANVPLVADAVANPGGRELNCATLPPIEVGLPAHSAPLGMSFLASSAVPAPWSQGAVVAVHGSWNREPPQAPAVLWMAWDPATNTLKPAVTLIGGFQNADGSRWGRPVDVVPGPDGALYVSDDNAGAIYRIVPAS